MADKLSFLDATKARRSLYALSKESPIPNDRIISLVEHAIRYAPSPFNARSCRCIVLFGDDHNKLWDMGAVAMQKLMPMAFDIFGPKIQGFRAGYGTVMFFEDVDSVKELSPRFAKLSEDNPEWYDHSSGMHQYVVWTALEAEGLGCNLQHYQDVIGDELAKTWDIPPTWKPKCQLVFGKPLAGPMVDKEKTFRPVEDCIKVYGQ